SPAPQLPGLAAATRNTDALLIDTGWHVDFAEAVPAVEDDCQVGEQREVEARELRIGGLRHDCPVWSGLAPAVGRRAALFDLVSGQQRVEGRKLRAVESEPRDQRHRPRVRELLDALAVGQAHDAHRGTAETAAR